MKIYDYTSKAEHSSAPSIFLAGPTPRDYQTMLECEWRTNAIGILNKLEFDGKVFVPGVIDKYGYVKGMIDLSYEEIVEWELEHLEKAQCIAFWIPRKPNQGMPGFTTNVEFGMFVKSGKCVLGYPEDAIHMNYIDYVAKLNNVPISNTLLGTMSKATILANTYKSIWRPYHG